MTDDGNAQSFRLPRHTAPHRYRIRIRIEPDLDKALFTGEETIEVEVQERTELIVLNALELAVERASVSRGWSSTRDRSSEEQTASIEPSPELEQVCFHFESPLEPGRYTLACSFSGTLNDRLAGFYRSTFVDADDVTHVIATTQFEETHARMAFPCFDEPDRKAVFEIELDVPHGLTALSNGPEIASEELPNGRRRVVFGPTMPMSTYLVAFVVGPMQSTEPVDVDAVPLRVYTVPGKTGLATHALDAGKHALRFFGDYFDIAYPAEKLDLVALPDFAAGAMENLGCVTFREAILLADPDNASRNELERLAEVVCHEIAHMWFGDLVTMAWWNGIWLNEAFATFMALCAQDDYRPEWNSFTSFSRSKAAALNVDALHSTRPIEFPVRHPDEAAAMFDILTYEKGAGVLWMIEQYLGRERFRAGVRRYLRTHRYANTETGDLWDAIESEAEGVPIREIMDSWIFQGGFPLVSATRVGPGTLSLRQEPFAFLPEARSGESAIGSDWVVPVLVAPLGSATAPARVVLRSTPAEIAASDGPVVVNAGGSGFFRVHYDLDSYRALLERFDEMGPVERFNFASDTWALVLAGRSDLSRLVELTEALANERDPYVWSVVVGAIALVDLVADEDRKARLAAFTRDLLGPQLERVGWEPRPDDDEQTPIFRSSLVATLGTIGNDESVVSRCRELFEQEQRGGAPIDPDLASAVLGVVASRATEAQFDAIVRRYRNPHNPNDQLRHLRALAEVSEPSLAARVLEMCLGEIRSQDAPYQLGAMLRNGKINGQAWQFITERFEAMVTRFPENSIHRMLEGVSALAQLDERGEPRYAPDVRTFCESHIVGARRKLVEQSLERLEINLRLAQAVRADRSVF